MWLRSGPKPGDCHVRVRPHIPPPLLLRQHLPGLRCAVARRSDRDDATIAARPIFLTILACFLALVSTTQRLFLKNAVSQRLAAACTVQAVQKCFVIRARSTQRYSQVPFPPVPRRLLFPFSCVSFQPSSRPPLLVPLHAPSASASLVAQRRRCARLPTPPPPTLPRAPPPLFILGSKPSLVAIHYRDSAFLSAATRSVSCRFAPDRGDAGRRFRHLLGCSRLYRLRLLDSPFRLPNPSATMHFSEQY
jgi:hypothetical protein